MPSVRCPHCQFLVELRGAKPGRFEPACPGCRRRFVLTVPADRKNGATAAVIKPKITMRLAAAPAIERIPEAAPLSFVQPTPLAMPEVHGRVGGYQIRQKLGHGSMGAVYLARHLALDREAAVKVLSPELSGDARFMSRFARQAYAAAQLRHPNLVQVYEVGPGFFSMEFVEGQTLAMLVKEKGKLEAPMTVGYILQAARGLKFAHDHGLLHRDLKPGNLLLDDQGVIKVADLGLVQRTVVAENTQLTVSIGSPAYMPPEQARNAAGIDGRADIYSLGCTLYKLVTGQRPFLGMTAQEILTQHATEPVPPPDRVDKTVPAALSFIVVKMLAKRPADRYASMSEVIVALESWLAKESDRPFAAKPDQISRLESAAARFNNSKWKIARTICIRTFLISASGVIVVLALPTLGYPVIAAGLVGFTLTTVVVYQILLGLTRRTFLLNQLRELIFSSSVLDWLTYLIVIASVVVLLLAFEIHWLWLGFAVGAIVMAGAFLSTVDLMLAKDREAAIAETLALVKEMRLQGQAENGVREFVCKYAGQNWEEFYEEIFGLEAKLLARHAWGQGSGGLLRPRFGTWREPILGWIDRQTQLRRNSHYRRMLMGFELRSLSARGMEARAARERARFNARQVVEKAGVIRETARLRSAETALPSHARAAIHFNDQVRAITTDWVHDDTRPADEHSPRYRREGGALRRVRLPFEILFGQTVRLVLAVVILAGFGVWRNLNGGLTAVESSLHPLRVVNVPNWICDTVGSWNGGLVGTLLLISTAFSGVTLGMGVIGSAAIGLMGHRWNGSPLNKNAIGSAVGAVIVWLITIFFLRRRKDLG